MSGDATGSETTSDVTVVTLEGVVRKRRSLSRRLAFVDLETDQATSVPLVADGWSLPKSITAGLCVRVEGVWETSGARGRRLALLPDGVIVLRDGRAENAWENASTSAAWRARVREMPADAKGTDDLGAMCLSWADSGRCSDPNCVARHCASSRWEIRRVARATARRRGARDAACPEGDARAVRAPPEDEAEAALSHGSDAAKSRHNAVFAAWLVDTFGVEALRGGENDGSSAHTMRPNATSGGVVDIAGGRGLLSFELALEHGVPVTLVDPKPLRLNKKTRRRVRKWRRETFSEDAPDDDSRLPVRHVRAAFEGVPATAVRTCGEAEPEEAIAAADERGTETKRRSISRAVREASALIAMHPDQATDAVFETALALDKPFAVVPCCVFADLNPHRVLASGAPVRTYDEMMEYYQAMGPDVRRARLAFQGRREVLYRLPPPR